MKTKELLKETGRAQMYHKKGTTEISLVTNGEIPPRKIAVPFHPDWKAGKYCFKVIDCGAALNWMDK